MIRGASAATVKALSYILSLVLLVPSGAGCSLPGRIVADDGPQDVRADRASDTDTADALVAADGDAAVGDLPALDGPDQGPPADASSDRDLADLPAADVPPPPSCAPIDLTGVTPVMLHTATFQPPQMSSGTLESGRWVLTDVGYDSQLFTLNGTVQAVLEVFADDATGGRARIRFKVVNGGSVEDRSGDGTYTAGPQGLDLSTDCTGANPVPHATYAQSGDALIAWFTMSAFGLTIKIVATLNRMP
jgi:hypothetical protein